MARKKNRQRVHGDESGATTSTPPPDEPPNFGNSNGVQEATRVQDQLGNGKQSSGGVAGKGPAPLPQAALESEIAAKERELSSLRNEVQALSEEIAVLRSERKDAQGALAAAQQNIESLEGQLQAARDLESVAVGRYEANRGVLALCCAGLAVTTAASALLAFSALRSRRGS
uniref:Uncharacterized protein n=1 Tax=Tetraselmis sp. GSL018 TaxID=582737 RepID=A0A061S7W9_9CHLO